MRAGLDEENNDNRTVYCGNLSENVTDGILFELFQQAGPVESVRRPRDPNQRPKSFAFIVYKHECSVPYALEIFRGIKLFNRLININSRSTLRHIPVLDTHITEFTEPKGHVGYEEVHFQETEPRGYQEREDNIRRRNRSARNEEVYFQESEPRMYQNMEDNRRERNMRDSHKHGSYSQNRHSQREKEPTSWAELNALRGKNLAHSNLRSDLQGNSERLRESSNGSQIEPDFNSLLQMGQQMLLPSGFMGMGGYPFPNSMPSVGDLGPGSPSLRGHSMLPSMSGMMDGGEIYSTERDRGRRDSHHRRESRRDHPYIDQVHQDHRDDHRRHDRGYSSARSSHDRERRDRRSR